MNCEIGEAIVKAIDTNVAEHQGSGLRSHLGASILGNQCVRSIWYSWRWAYSKKHTGRILRLFERGHREEPALIHYLRQIGAVVEDKDPETGNQWRIKDHDNHFGGSADGIVSNLDRFGLEGRGLLEFKTHGEKSFTALKAKGVVSSKIEHYVQVQIYMRYLKLRWALYCAVNKNTDELYFEVVYYKPEVAERYVDRAQEIIQAAVAPPRISEDSSWWICRMCDYHEICHHDAQMHRNCRSCMYAEPRENGKWFCDKFKSEIPHSFLYTGCEEWEQVGQ